MVASTLRQKAAGAAGMVAIAAIALGLMACDRYVTVTGVVREPSGTPLRGVVVTLQTVGREPDRASTANDGSFNVGIVGAEPQRTRISFRKEGFQQLEEVVGKEERRAMEVTLLPN